jgi:4-amino-4-deoxy-L-arabinose transferase-like glycosyltransferase
VGAASALGHSELLVRLPFALCGGLSILIAARLARELSTAPWVPAAAALCCAFAPALVAESLALPDAPLTTALSVVLWLVVRGRTRDLPLAGVAFGVALLAKYSAATLLPGLAAVALLDANLRRSFLGWRPYLAMGLACLVFAPCLSWNARHDFVSLAFQIHHGMGNGFSPATLALCLGAELASAGPLTLLAARVLWRPPSLQARRLALLIAAPLLWFAFAAARGRFEANWPAFLTPALCAATAAGLAQLSPRAAGRLLAAATALSCAALGLLALELRHPHFPAVERVGLERFHDGRALAAAVRDSTGPGDPFLFTYDYQDAGELAFYGGYTRLGPVVERPSQLDVWRALPRVGEDFFFVGFGEVTEPIAARYRARRHRHAQAFSLALRGSELRHGTVTPFEGFLGLGER